MKRIAVQESIKVEQAKCKSKGKERARKT